MKNNFDSRHTAQSLPPGDTVWLPNEETEASVLEKTGPRSYNVATPNGTLQMNRRPIPHNDNRSQIESSTPVTPDDNSSTEHRDSAANVNRANDGVPNTPMIPAESNKKVVKTSSGRVSRPQEMWRGV